MISIAFLSYKMAISDGDFENSSAFAVVCAVLICLTGYKHRFQFKHIFKRTRYRVLQFFYGPDNIHQVFKISWTVMRYIKPYAIRTMVWYYQSRRYQFDRITYPIRLQDHLLLVPSQMDIVRKQIELHGRQPEILRASLTDDDNILPIIPFTCPQKKIIINQYVLEISQMACTGLYTN